MNAGSLPPEFMPSKDGQPLKHEGELPPEDTRTKGEMLSGGRFRAYNDKELVKL